MDGLKRIMLQDLTDKVSEICDNFYENCVALLARLVACQSISGNERECAEVLLTFFRDRNIPCFRDSRGSILAVSLPRQFEPEPLSEHGENAGKWLRVELKKARDKGLKILAFNAHMDVVSAENPEEWRSDPFWAVRRNGRIYGRGTCDMKGALAAMAMSMAVAREVDRDFDRKCVVLGCFCTEEEVAEGLAFRDLFEEFGLKPDMVILGEPSKMQIARGQRGKLEIMVETSGVCAHTSVPEAGDNAAYKLARVLLAIENVEAEERFKFGMEPNNTMKRSTVVATTLKSWPHSRSFVPDKAMTHVTARLAMGETLATLSKKLQADENWPDARIIPIVYRGKSYLGVESDWNAEHSAWETEQSHPFFGFLAAAYEELCAEKPLDKIWPFSTDGVYSAGIAGIPTLGIGPGHEEVAHKTDEWVSEDELKKALKLYSFLPFFRAEK